MPEDRRHVAERLVMPNADAPCELVHQVEGVPLDHPAEARVLAHGARMLVVEVVMPADQGSPEHVHDHESVGYVVRGRVRSTIDGVVYELGPGDGFRHPRGVAHDMAALWEEAVWVEIKSPPATTWVPEE
jgi:quercetin dioxygenase-like cupin family protein